MVSTYPDNNMLSLEKPLIINANAIKIAPLEIFDWVDRFDTLEKIFLRFNAIIPATIKTIYGNIIPKNGIFNV